MATSGHDRAITDFSPDGRLLQVEYAQEAVNEGPTAVGVCGKEIVVLAVEKSVEKLQEERTMRNICLLDDHVAMAFSGLTADARILTDRARVECQSRKLNYGDPVTPEYITRYIAQEQQRFTQSNGQRPFGVSALIAGFDYDGTPHLFQTDPSGCYHEWKATATGKSAETVREYLEKNYSGEISDESTIKLAIKALLVVQGSNLEVAVMKKNRSLRMLDADEISSKVSEIEEEDEG